ncbi:RICIN domain-containing protein [Microbispora siamensis]
MPNIRCSALLTSTITSAVLVVFPAAAHADTTNFNMRIINKMDGSRMSLSGDAVAEGTRAVTLRAPTIQHRSARWTITEKDDGFLVIKNEVAGKCLQPASGAPNAGDTLVVKTCDGSPLQDWSRRDEVSETNVNTEWGSLRPRTNTSLAITLQTYEASGTWDHIYLDQDQNSSDRLWHFTRPDAVVW